MNDDLKDFSMADLFRQDAEVQLAALTTGLLALENGTAAADQLEALMRAAHSLKGAARIAGLDAAVRVAHAMEDAFVAVQRGEAQLRQPQVDQLLAGVDLLGRIAGTPEAERELWLTERAGAIEAFLAELKAVLAGERDDKKAPAVAPPPAAPAPPEAGVAAAEARYLRVTAHNLNRLLGLAGESLVESRWLRPFGTSLGRMKRGHASLAYALDHLHAEIEDGAPPAQLAEAVTEVQRHLAAARDALASRLDELDTHDRRATNLAYRFYGEALAVRMRPFADGIGGFPRMVRDVARQLGKEVRFEIVGENTQVDRDILAKLEAPLGHLLRNAIDHGIEPPAARVAAGKPRTGVVKLEAHHHSGQLLITVTDDGGGVDLTALRAAIVRKKLVAAETAPRLSEGELLEFLFLPGFTMKETVTDISGRGVGLDVVRSTLKTVRGAIRLTAQSGRGTRFALQLPLTLSVARALLVEVGGEPYAFPLGFIARTLRLSQKAVATTEGRPHFEFDGRRVGLIAAHEVLGCAPGRREDDLSVVVLSEEEQHYGVIVEKFLGERELVVQPLDPRLGKVPDIAAGALMENGEPVLILDVEDVVRSIEKITASKPSSSPMHEVAMPATGVARKRVLVVDDSITVRELVRKLLEARGYVVESAVDGMDGWNAVRVGAFDLVISDVDMPRLDGIELTKMIKRDARLRLLPVMIVSYKDRDEDRRRGLEAGADYYLTKGSFQDMTMIEAVRDLIGEAVEEDAPP